MVPIKTTIEIEKMRIAGAKLAKVFEAIKPLMRAGVTTFEIDRCAEETLIELGCEAPCKGYQGFPTATCISLNEVIVHGIPSMRILRDGDIVSVDIVVRHNGYCADGARTYAIGQVDQTIQRLIDVAKKAFYAGVAEVKAGARLGNVQSAVQMTTELAGFSVIRAMAGHGIGKSMHEDPSIPNHGRRGTGLILKKGMCLAIEPMISAGSFEVEIDKADKWTCRTIDGSLTAHYENTVLVTGNGYEILTPIVD